MTSQDPEVPQEPNDGLVWASELDALRAALGYGDMAIRITAEEKAQRERQLVDAPLQGELSEDDKDFKEILRRVINDLLGQEPSVLYNPGCGEHVSLATAFPDARTIFLDSDGDVQHRFIQHNIDKPGRQFEFYRGNMHTFTLPEDLRADAVLILNAGYMTNDELNTVTKPGSLVMVNEWHSAASYMREHCPDYPFMATYEYAGETNDLHVFRRS